MIVAAALRRMTLVGLFGWMCALSAPLIAAPQQFGQESSGQQQSEVSRDEQRKLDTALAGGQANSVEDLSVLVQKVCKLQAWQFALTPTSRREVRVDRSPTMSTNSASCIYAVIGQSKFSANPLSQR